MLIKILDSFQEQLESSIGDERRLNFIKREKKNEISENCKKSDANEAKFVQDALKTVKQRIRQANGVVQMAIKRIDAVNKDPNVLNYSDEFAELIMDCKDEIKYFDSALKTLDTKNSKLG